MNKHLLKVKAMLEKQKSGIDTKLKASLTAEQKTKLEETLSQVNEALTALETADTEATLEQITAVFAKAIEALQNANEQATEEMQAQVSAKLTALQTKFEQSQKAKVVSAKLSLHRLAKSEDAKDSEGYKPYSAGVNVEAWTPESEIDNVETFRQLIGVAAGLETSTTNQTSVKVRKFGLNSGSATVVVKHGVAPELVMLGAQTSVSVDTYRGVVEGIADEDLDDNPGLENEIQTEALENLGQVENLAAITLLKGVAVAFINANFGTKYGADSKTALAAIIDMIRQKLGNRASEICLALNSSQWALLNDLRNDNGTPIPVDSVVGDITKIVDNNLVGDEFICWAKKFAKLKIYKGKTADWYRGIKSTVVDGKVTSVYSEWRTGEQSVAVKQRQVMYVSDATTVVKGNIANVVAAVTTTP